MMKLISAVAAILLTTSTLATAAPRKGAVGKTSTATHRKVVKRATPAKRSPAKAPTAAPAKATVVQPRPHDVRAEEIELKRLKTNVKTAEKAGDWRRAARDRRAMYQLEADVRADKADDKDRQRAARNTKKKSRIPFWGWWR